MSSVLSSSKEYDVIISVGSGSVYGAIVEFEKNSPAKILCVRESEFPVKEKIQAEELSTFMLSSLHKTITELAHDHKKKIKNTHVIFASPWFSSFSKSIHIEKPEAFNVQEKTIEKLIAEQFSEIFKEVSGGSSIIVEKALSHIKLNGYQTAAPYGKMAKTLDVSVYASVIPAIIREKIESEIYTVVHPHSIILHTFPFVAWDVIMTLFSPKEDFIFVDIGSEVTDALVVLRGAIHSLVSFPVGKNHLVRKVALATESTPELATSMISLFASDTVDAPTKEKMSALVEAFGQEWTIRFLSAIHETKEIEHFLPQRAYVVSDQKISDLFSGIIIKQIPNTISLSRENLSQFVEFGSGETPNIFIALGAIYCNARFADKKSFTNRRSIL